MNNNLKCYSSIIIFLLYCISANATSDKIYTHGYVGTPSFNINDPVFNLHIHNKCKYYFNDIHFHPLNFVMEGKSLIENIPFMDKNCINHSTISALPLLKAWQEG